MPDIKTGYPLLIDNSTNQTIAGYRVIRELGRGGMGVALLAVRDGQEVVLKEALGAREDLQREAAFLGNLRHPGLPKVFNYEEGYMIMEYVAGKTIAERIESLQKTPEWDHSAIHLQDTVSWILQIANVLNYLHSLNPHPILHRDIKPENVIIRESNGQAALIDFGIARHFDQDKFKKNIKDTIGAGTLGFMAPEQKRGITSPRSDIYSLGMLLRYCLDGVDPQEVKKLPKLKNHAELTWQGLVEVTRQAIHQSPAKRFQSAADLATELAKYSAEKADRGQIRPCPQCKTPIVNTCRFCPGCGSATHPVSEAPDNARENVSIEFISEHQQTISAVVNAAAQKSPASLDHFRAYQLLREMDQDPGFNRLISLEGLPRVERMPHQIEAASRALGEMRGRCLLADEVGLGKTIEAGIITKELMIREKDKEFKCLILAPQPLCSQWQEEFFDKFDLFFLNFGRDVDYSLAWECDRLIAPYQILYDKVYRDRILQQRYDLVIMDEAHHLLKDDERIRWIFDEFATRIVTKHCLMLSATPLRNDLSELHRLLTFLKPGSVGDFQTFKQRYISKDDPLKPRNTEELRALLARVMIRNRRVDIGGMKFPQRRAHRVAVRVQGKARDILTRFRKFCQTELQNYMELNHHLRDSVQTMVESFHSSPAAFGRQLDELLSTYRRVLKPQDINQLKKFNREMELKLLEDKFNKAVEIVGKCVDDGHKVLVFSQYEDTADLLFRRLTEHLSSPVARYPKEDDFGDGGLALEALQKFRDNCVAMVCTGNASEGLNLQFCDCMVNFDLPWDPMKLEQRIGRIQRIGQASSTVQIFNLFLEDTVEGQILEILEKKILMFGKTIGQVEEILGKLVGEESMARMYLDLYLQDGNEEGTRKTMEALDSAIQRPDQYSVANKALNRLIAGDPGQDSSARSELSGVGEPETTSKCANCGNPYEREDQYCANCGEEVRS